MLVASPVSLADYDVLTHPSQLMEHCSIAHRAWSEWVLKRHAEYYSWLLLPMHMTDDLVYARECALGNAGIALLPFFLLNQMLPQGD